MSVTLNEVRAFLDPDEPNYSQAATLGEDALPHLQKLATGTDPLLAAKAVYLASLISAPESLEILKQAAVSAEPTVRISAAAGFRNISGRKGSKVLTALSKDEDAGVRRVALNSIEVRKPKRKPGQKPRRKPKK